MLHRLHTGYVALLQNRNRFIGEASLNNLTFVSITVSGLIYLTAITSNSGYVAHNRIISEWSNNDSIRNNF